MSAGLVILGTDTEVGKTYVACGLARGLIARGWRPHALKPVETGYEASTCDGRYLAEACGEAFDPQLHVPQRYDLALSPLAAAREAGRPFDVVAALRHARDRAHGCDLLIVETAGGIRVPLSEGVSNLEFAQRLGWPTLLVARAGLGTINHSVLSLEVAGRGDVDCIGFVLNGEGDRSESAGGGNRAIIEQWTRIPCVGEIPAGAVVEEHLDWNRILPAMGRRERAE